MNLLNATKFQAAYTMGVDKHARESIVVVVKATYLIPEQPGEEPALAPQQQPLVFADEYTGEPGFSAPLRETDFSPIKHRCDVLLTGSAYAPEARPVTRLRVGLKVGPLVKSFDVVGDRRWEVDAFLRFRPSEPEPFSVMPISYDNAFGGRDEFSPDPAKHSAYMANPVGRGYHRELDQELVIGTPLPNTEETGRPVERPDGDYRPMAFGPVGRGWLPRLRFAGTYDDWLENHFPFLPPDFDEAYFQAAPQDQQIPFLQGGEEVVLWHLTPGGKTWFRLPTVKVPVVFFRKRGERTETEASCDTLHLEPDRGIFTLTWRVTEPIRRDIFEFSEILVGEMPRAWWRARETGKTWYPSLAHLVDARRKETLEED